MAQALFTYFYNYVFNDNNLQQFYTNILGQSINLRNYLSYLAEITCLIIIFVLCCLFIYRLVRLVGRLFSGGTL